MEPAGLIQFQTLITRLISLAVPGAFIVLLLMFLSAGFKYITSGGEPKGVQSAQSTITWAILGILFLIVGWLALLLIRALTGVDVTKFCIGFPGAATACP